MSVLAACALVTAAVAGARGTWSPCGLSMLSSINRFSEAARGHRYAVTCGWFVLGAALGGLLLGTGTAVLALVGAGLPAPGVLAATAALVCLAADLRLLPLPVHPRQVDETWLRTYRPWVYGVGFGAQIGAGLATYVMTAATYLLVALAALTGSPAVALGCGLVFGVVRGLAVLLGARVATPAQLHAVLRRLEELGPASLRVAMVVQALVAVLLGGVVAAGAVLALVVSSRAVSPAGAPRPVPPPAAPRSLRRRAPARRA